MILLRSGHGPRLFRNLLSYTSVPPSQSPDRWVTIGLTDLHRFHPQTGASSMRTILGWPGVLSLIFIPCGLYNLASLGDEPTRPTASATEANPATPAAGHSLHGEAFDDGPRHHAVLIPGMGRNGFAVSTRKPEAQEFINQGV